MLPYFGPPPVPLTWVWLNPFMSPVGSQPELDSLDPTSGPALIIPHGHDGPGIVVPPPSTPMNGSPWFARQELAAVTRAHMPRMAIRPQLMPRIAERAR